MNINSYNPETEKEILPKLPKKIRVAGQVFYQDNIGNLIREEFVKEQGRKISTPSNVLPFLQEYRTESQEHLLVVTLDGGNNVIKVHNVTKGLVDQTQCHPREVFRVAIADNAVSILLAHNHPSGSKEPSGADLVATRRIKEAGELIGIPLLDHLILTSLTCTSIRERKPSLF